VSETGINHYRFETKSKQ